MKKRGGSALHEGYDVGQWETILPLWHLLTFGASMPHDISALYVVDGFFRVALSTLWFSTTLLWCRVGRFGLLEV